jgi:hypothetical protein
MSTTASLDAQTSAESQQRLLADIDKKISANKRDATFNFGLGLTGLAVYTAMTLLFPPAGIAGAVASVGVIVASLQGWDLIENLGKHKSLKQAKQEAAGDPAAPQARARAESHKKWYRRALFGTLGGLLVAAAVAIAAPLVVPAAVASAAAGALAVATIAVGGVATQYFDGTRKAAAEVVKSADRYVGPPAQKPQPSPQDEAAAALSQMLSPSPGFDRAANRNSEPVPQQPSSATPATKPPTP